MRRTSISAQVVAGLALATLAVSACSGSGGRSATTAQTTTPVVFSVPAPKSPPFLTATAREAAITPTANPTPTPCKVLVNVAAGTPEEIYKEHGHLGYCSFDGGHIMLGVDGAPAADALPGFMICTPPSGNPGPDCGIYVGARAYLANWSFFPFPASDAGIVDLHPVFPQRYLCVGNATELWAFHFDSRTYTAGCRRAPDWTGIFGRPCDTFLYVGTPTTSPLYAQHGKPVACAAIGTMIVGVMEGNPQPGMVVCDTLTATNAERASKTCGISFDPELSPNPWSFVPLPVAEGPADGATFDTGSGTACVAARGQSFTFTVASRAITTGCSQ